MVEKLTKRLRVYLVAGLALWEVAHLLWEQLHGGIKSHHFLAMEEMPAISNVWGLILLPVLAWFLSAGIQNRIHKQPQGTATKSKVIAKVVIGFIGSLIYGVLLSYFFTMGNENMSAYLFFGMLLMALILPIFRGEYLLGFIMGMTFTFGAVLPTLIATVIACLSALMHLIVFPGIVKVLRWLKPDRRIILILVVAFTVAVVGLMAYSQRKISSEEAVHRFEKLLQKEKFEKDFTGVQWAVESETASVKWQGASGTSEGKALTAETPFHAASIGKLMTSVLVYQAVESGKIKLNEPISSYLPANLLNKLFIIDGKDFSQEVTILQLLSHTSGVGGYFDDPVTQGLTMADYLKQQPDKLWTPNELIAFTANNQTPIGKPGETYHYSDTGYVLLGKILEQVEGKPYHSLLQEQIFKPLGMSHSTALFDENEEFLYTGTMSDVWLNGDNLLHKNGLSVGWAGGGIVTTLSNLLAFSKALHEGELISKEHYDLMFKGDERFREGIHYGAGGMTLHFEEFSFMLKDLPTMNGHIGVLSTHLFYDPRTKTHIVMNFGSSSKMNDSFKILINMMMILSQIKK